MDIIEKNNTSSLFQVMDPDPKKSPAAILGEKLDKQSGQMCERTYKRLMKFNPVKSFWTLTPEPGFYFLIIFKRNIFFAYERFILEDGKIEEYIHILSGHNQVLVRNASIKSAWKEVIETLNNLNKRPQQ